MNHQYFLTQLAFGIKHLPPTIPEAEQQQILALFETLEAHGEALTDSVIESTMIEIGKIEWPYRRAYKDMVMLCCSHTQHDLFLKTLSPKTKKKVIEMGGEEITVAELVHAPFFEEKLSPEERYEVQEAALNARLQMHDFMENQITTRPNDYKKSLEKAFAQQKELDEAIQQLSALAAIDPHWQPEIEGKVRQFLVGWSISEPDVSVADVRREVDYWKETLAASEEEEATN